MRPRFSSLSMLRVREPSREALEPWGIPLRYRSLRSPCAKTENAMQPTPSAAMTSRRRSSIQRLNIEYEG